MDAELYAYSYIWWSSQLSRELRLWMVFVYASWGYLFLDRILDSWTFGCVLFDYWAVETLHVSLDILRVADPLDLTRTWYHC